jgi:hypothetical protein
MSAQPADLAVVLVTPRTSAILRGTLRHLREQTLRDRIEVVLVGPDAPAFADLDVRTMDAFARWSTLAVGPVTEAERALAAGFAATAAPLVALLENHVYPDPDWATAVLRAHQGPWAVVGGVIDNANPESATSWVEHLLSYGFHDSTAAGGEARVSRNNVTFKRTALASFGEGLADAMARDGGLLDELGRGGGRAYREPRARLRHLNVSRLGSMLLLRIHSARASAATRARLGRWSAARRWLYVAGSPAIPLRRLRALWPRLRAPADPAPARIWPLLALTLIIDGFGQALGFAFGSGRSAERAGRFDLDRHRYLSPADRKRFAE